RSGLSPPSYRPCWAHSKKPPASLLVGGFRYLGVTITILTLSLILSLILSPTLSLIFMQYIDIHPAEAKYPI
ncbi:hypothetical protein, partial [Phascolarctobacterium succinatutens]|uniref:hypothetical protein n=1 Tax=Phascolarctobacterium succinatutens TaxID=626940 RepID=UPI003076932F